MFDLYPIFIVFVMIGLQHKAKHILIKWDCIDFNQIGWLK